VHVSVALFTADLWVNDNPVLQGALRDAERVVPLFVVDTDIRRTGFAVPNRVAFLADSLTDLDAALRARGGRLVVRFGGVVETTYALADDDTRRALERFLGDPESGIFRGPYLRIRTPFHQADSGWERWPEWRPGFTPWRHQARAWQRLSTLGAGTPSRRSSRPVRAPARPSRPWCRCSTTAGGRRRSGGTA
jgi:hypothetical protein